MNNRDLMLQSVTRLLCEQRYAVLATTGSDGPYASLVAYVVDESRRHLYFATARSTRKYGNLKEDRRVALIIDNRNNEVQDTYKAMGVTALGEVHEMHGDERQHHLDEFLAVHEHLKDFVSSDNVAFMRVDIKRCNVVNRFQEVFELDMR